MAHPYDDYEAYRTGRSGAGEPRRWPREQWGRTDEWRSGEHERWRAESDRDLDRSRDWRSDEARYGDRSYGDRSYGGRQYGAWHDEPTGAPRRRDMRAAGDTLEGGDLGWHGGVKGAEGGGGYGGGFFGTAYGLYAGRPERTPESRVGRGPKGYRRSDERIHDEVCERIARSGVNADEVEVKVENGEVTLSGTVDRREHKWHLENLCESVFGVDDVHNNLRSADRARRGDVPPTH